MMEGQRQVHYQSNDSNNSDSCFLNEQRSNFGWLLQMSNWSIGNIKTGKMINVDQSRDHALSMLMCIVENNAA